MCDEYLRVGCSITEVLETLGLGKDQREPMHVVSWSAIEEGNIHMYSE